MSECIHQRYIKYLLPKGFANDNAISSQKCNNGTAKYFYFSLFYLYHIIDQHLKKTWRSIITRITTTHAYWKEHKAGADNLLEDLTPKFYEFSCSLIFVSWSVWVLPATVCLFSFYFEYDIVWIWHCLQCPFEFSNSPGETMVHV